MFKNHKIFSSLIILSLIIVLLPCEALAARPRLAIRPFTNKTDNRSVPVDAITDMMTTELGNAKLFNLLEREKIDYLADEIRLGQSGLIDQSTAPKVGKIKGAQYTMTGSVTMYYYSAKGGAVGVVLVGGVAAAKTAYVTLDIRIIDNTTGEIVYVNSEQGSAKRKLEGVSLGFVAGGNATYGGILAAATRDAVMKHVAEMKEYDWDD